MSDEREKKDRPKAPPPRTGGPPKRGGFGDRSSLGGLDFDPDEMVDALFDGAMSQHPIAESEGSPAPGRHIPTIAGAASVPASPADGSSSAGGEEPLASPKLSTPMRAPLRVPNAPRERPFDAPTATPARRPVANPPPAVGKLTVSREGGPDVRPKASLTSPSPARAPHAPVARPAPAPRGSLGAPTAPPPARAPHAPPPNAQQPGAIPSRAPASPQHPLPRARASAKPEAVVQNSSSTESSKPVSRSPIAGNSAPVAPGLGAPASPRQRAASSISAAVPSRPPPAAGTGGFKPSRAPGAGLVVPSPRGPVPRPGSAQLAGAPQPSAPAPRATAGATLSVDPSVTRPPPNAQTTSTSRLLASMDRNAPEAPAAPSPAGGHPDFAEPDLEAMDSLWPEVQDEPDSSELLASPDERLAGDHSTRPPSALPSLAPNEVRGESGDDAIELARRRDSTADAIFESSEAEPSTLPPAADGIDSPSTPSLKQHESRSDQSVPAPRTAEQPQNPRLARSRPDAAIPSQGEDPDPSGELPTMARSPSTRPSSPGSLGFQRAAQPRGPVATLDDLVSLEDWAGRASWIQEQARALNDGKAQAQQLTVASELWAIAGDSERARECANLALQANAHLAIAQRQARWLAAAQNDWEDVSLSLDAELKLATTPEARCHAAHLAAHIQTAKLHNLPRGRARSELAGRAHGDDIRAHVIRSIEQLSSTGAPPALRLPELPSLQPFQQSLAFLAHLRGGAPVDNEVSPAIVLDNLGRALASGDAQRSATAALDLARVRGLEPAATWLAASLFSQDSESRGRALDLLEALASTHPSPAIQRAIVQLAWEISDTTCAERIDRQGTKESLTIAERLSYSLLSTSPGGAAAQLADEAEADENLSALVALARDLLSSGQRPPPTATADARVKLEFARSIAAGNAASVATSTEQLRTHAPDDPLHLALDLVQGAAAGDAGRCAAALEKWPEDDHGFPAVARMLAEAVLYELADRSENARQPYDAALALEPLHEGVGRALAACPGSPPLYEILETLADVAGDDERSSLLLTEAAQLRGQDDENFESLLTRAAEAAPNLPFAFRAAEHAARARGDATALVTWLQRRRETLADPSERALDCVREALLVAPHDAKQALRLLEEAALARPESIAIHELLERMSSPEMVTERITWRERIAEHMPAPERSWTLACVARELSSGGETSRARAVAETVLSGTRSPLVERVVQQLIDADADIVARIHAGIGTLAADEPRESLETKAQRALEFAVERVLPAELSTLLQELSERLPDSLPLLRWAEHTRLGEADIDSLQNLVQRIATFVTGGESEAHWRLALRLAQYSGDFGRSTETCRALLDSGTDMGEWANWANLNFALPAAPPTVQLRATSFALDAFTSPVDRAALACVAAQASLGKGSIPSAIEYLDQATRLVPDARTALSVRGNLLANVGRNQDAATTFEAHAEASGVDATRVDSLCRAARIWLDRVGDSERATSALERAFDLAPDHEDLFERLRSLYVAQGSRVKLVALLERRLGRADTSKERARFELMRARALLELGDAQAAKDAVTVALADAPQHEQALELLASLCQSGEDWQGERDTLLRLLDLRSAPEEQAALNRRLGQLYAGPLSDSTSAQAAFQACLRVVPADYDSGMGLAEVLADSGSSQPALDLLAQLADAAPSAELKRDFTIALAGLQNRLLSDTRVAERTFEKARRTWPGDPKVLEGFATFLISRGDQNALDVLLDRSTNEARRALGTGRFQTQFFESLETIARLRKDESSRRIIASSLAALRGEELTLDGAGAAALDDTLDELLAPDHLMLPLRALLSRAGHIIEAAYPYDLESIQASPLDEDSGEWEQQLRAVAASVGVDALEVRTSDRLGTVCIAARTSPPTVVFGSPLLSSSDVRARDFLFARAIKLIQAKAAAISNAAPLELWPMIAAFLSALAPGWSPAGLDPAKFARARDQMSSSVAPEIALELAPLALEVAETIGNRASQMGQLVTQWAARSALLAIGSPTAALRGLACALGQPPAPPASPAERLKWVIRHAEARDLMSFSATDAYASARRRLGLVDL